MRNAYKILVGKSEGNTPPGRPKPRCKERVILEKQDVTSGNGLISLRTGTRGRFQTTWK
jgi:hypothetical protein